MPRINPDRQDPALDAVGVRVYEMQFCFRAVGLDGVVSGGVDMPSF
jgi:hypothetical protein